MKRIIAQHPVILIADHDVLLRNLLRGVLRSAYDILVAADSHEALRLSRASRKKPIDLLLSDAQMPGMDVPLLRDRILAERPQTKVLLMSSVITEPVDDAGQPLPFVQKPVELHTLRARIQELLDEPSVNRDRLKTILVVDDNLTRRERTGRILIRHRYAVLTAGSMEEAAALTDGTTNIDLIVSAVMMHDQSGGIGVAEHADVSGRNISTLLISHYDPAILRNMPGFSAQPEFLPNPFTPAALLKRVRRLLQNQPGQQRNRCQRLSL